VLPTDYTANGQTHGGYLAGTHSPHIRVTWWPAEIEIAATLNIEFPHPSPPQCVSYLSIHIVMTSQQVRHSVTVLPIAYEFRSPLAWCPINQHWSETLSGWWWPLNITNWQELKSVYYETSIIHSILRITCWCHSSQTVADDKIGPEHDTPEDVCCIQNRSINNTIHLLLKIIQCIILDSVVHNTMKFLVLPENMSKSTVKTAWVSESESMKTDWDWPQNLPSIPSGLLSDLGKACVHPGCPKISRLGQKSFSANKCCLRYWEDGNQTDAKFYSPWGQCMQVRELLLLTKHLELFLCMSQSCLIKVWRLHNSSGWKGQISCNASGTSVTSKLLETW